MNRNIIKLKVLLFLFILTGIVYPQDSQSIKDRYEKAEYKIEMRDGAKLFTSVYTPKDKTELHPILIWRTPYSCAPYGKDKFSRYLKVYKHFTDENFILVIQDVRGRFMSEGKFVDMRPYIPNKKTKYDVDEASDTYDTVDWLLRNIPNNNGKVGFWGISYPGFYAAMAAMANHPAIKAVSPQAPIANWFIDDDMHHNGAFTLLMAFNFFKVFGQPRDTLTTKWPTPPQYASPDAYTFFLNLGPLKNADEKYFHHKIKFWNDAFKHGTYDKFWQARNTTQYFQNVKPAVMTIGGWFDSEDLYGALHTYSAIEKKNPNAFNILVMGPWPHGAWGRGNVSSFGDMNFGENTSEFYRKNIETPFFNYYLKDKGQLNLPEANVYETGNNEWHSFDDWPPKDIERTNLYFHSNEQLSFSKPKVGKNKFDEYLSDPNKPVPYTAKILDSKRFYNRTYMVEDQRFAAERPDVLVYESAPLDRSITIAGPIGVDLFVSTTGTDADWVIKVIDVFPDSAKNPVPNPKGIEMGGYQMMIRYDIFRGKFRNGFDNPKPFIPNHVTEVKFDLQDILHTFKKDHKIMVQVQSSFFPFFDRNPQTYTDIYHADEKDFVKAYHKVYHSKKYPSSVIVNVLK